MAAAAILMLAPFDTTASIISFVIFFMLYPPCIANIKALAVKTSARTAWGIVALNFAVAYAVGFVYFMCAVMTG